MSSVEESTNAEQQPDDSDTSFFRRVWNIDDNWLELVAVVLLSVASLAAAWSGYQSARWGGVQSTLYSEASATRVESTRASTAGYLTTLADLDLFNGWAEAYATDNQELLDFYRNRFPPELEVATVAWLATKPLQNPDAPPGPISMPEYVNPNFVKSDDLENQASATFDKGKEANQQSDDYVLTTVFLAMVLFFSGISTRLTWRPAKVPVIVFALLILLVSLIRLASFPIQ